MIQLTRLDGTPLYINEHNIQWIEVMPDTIITFIGGARVIVREKLHDVYNILQLPPPGSHQPNSSNNQAPLSENMSNVSIS